MTRPRTHYNRGETRKALVLDAAVEVIAEHGLEGVTHRAIAGTAGVPLSTTSYFFTSLDELIGAAVTRIADGVLTDVEALVAEASTVVDDDSRQAYVDRLLEVVTTRERQILVQFEGYLGATRRPDLVEPVQRIIDAYEHAAAAVLGVLGASDPDRQARQLVALLDGFALQRIVSPRPDDNELLREAVRTFAASWLPAREG